VLLLWLLLRVAKRPELVGKTITVVLPSSLVILEYLSSVLLIVAVNDAAEKMVLNPKGGPGFIQRRCCGEGLSWEVVLLVRA